MPEPMAASDSYTVRLRDEQIRQLLHYAPLIIGANLVGGGIVVFVMWEVVRPAALLGWFGALFAVMVYASFALLAYHRSGPVVGSYRRWMNHTLFTCAAAGVLWGATGVLFFTPQAIEYQAFLLLILVGMGAGALSMISYLPAYYAFFPITMAPVSIMLLGQSGKVQLAFGAMAVFYLIGMSTYARLAGRTLLNSLRLQFENVDLVEELSREKREAEQANIAKSRFLAAASHDLRQPLHALMLFTSALDARATQPELRDIVGNIKTSSRAMEELFNALLDISRLDAGVLEPERAHFHVSALSERLQNDFALAAEHKGTRLDCAPCNVVAFTDPVLLERILRNFLANAVKYTDDGSVRLTCVERDDEIRLEVSDTGIGIAPEQQSEIFREFHQLGNPERDRSKGLGLGLAIVDRIARLLQHPVGVESEPGRGACFHVTVPRGRAELAAASVSEISEPGFSDLEGLRVVVVDDEAGVREGMRTLLQMWGCKVVLAGDHEEAVAALGKRGPDAIIVDYRLREKRTGVQAIEHLRGVFGAAAPALIITGDIAPESLKEARASGHQLAHKPVQPAVLRSFLRNVRKRLPAG